MSVEPTIERPERRPLLRDRMGRRLVLLFVGLVLFGVSLAMMVQADLGVGPWDVLHQGLARHTPWSFGTVVIAVSVVVLLAWIPLRERPGIGTVANAIVIGLVVDATLEVLAMPTSVAGQWAMMVSGVVLNGIATGLYIGAGLGPGPRDGLMTGIAARGHPIFAVRAGLELTVLLAGWLLGGTVGVGTIAFALAIGPLAHVFLRLLTLPDQAEPHPA
jgi:uncharacterized membrane protein YczE